MELFYILVLLLAAAVIGWVVGYYQGHVDGIEDANKAWRETMNGTARRTTHSWM